MIEFHSEQTNQSFLLKALGYQFPNGNESDFDDNWLNFEIEFRRDDQVSKKIDPLLLTWECIELSNWVLDFFSLPVGEKIMNLENTLCFTKREFGLDITETNIRIQIHKSLISFPIDTEEAVLDFQITESECLKISEAFGQILHSFPIVSKG
ncbi:hypothetical protein EHQ42_14885 [Leptospira levettii]|uniref:WapI family immunity protein n=1 Tax=Leptospira levettii TaxID=2023178 RepID=UPI00108290F1|nr:hypothetical protein [Leptospira levettii]TGL13091.1 hypothetical protein EHQ42_14885 [Leptospira levettii]